LGNRNSRLHIRSDIKGTGIVPDGKNAWKVKLLGYGQTRILIVSKHPGTLEALKEKKRRKSSLCGENLFLEIFLRGQTFITIRLSE